MATFTNTAKSSVSTASLVQSAKGYTGNSPLAIAFSSPVTKGNLLVVCASAAVLTDITVTDNQNNTWTLAVKKTGLVNATNVNASIFYAVANGNNTPTVTISAGAFSDEGGSIYEYAGLSTNYVSNSVLLSSSTTTPTATSLTTTAVAFIVAMAAQETSAETFSASGGGFTLRQTNGTHIDAVADYQNAPAGSYAAIFNTNVTSKWIILQVAFYTLFSNTPKSTTSWTNSTKN